MVYSPWGCNESGMTWWLNNNNISEVHSCCSMCQDVLPFLTLKNMPLYAYSTFVDPFIHKSTPDWFHLLGAMNNAAMNVDAQVSL